MNGPLVSAIVPAHNSAPFIEAAVKSVLDQTYSRVECVLVDDGSSDETCSIAASISPDLRVIRQANQGVSVARNRGISEAKGDLIAFLDADDVWLPDRLEKQVPLFEDAEVGLVYGAFVEADEYLRPLRTVSITSPKAALRNTIVLEEPIISIVLTGIVRTKIARSVGGFDPELSTSADVDFAYRVLLHCSSRGVPQPVAIYRQHSSQMHLNIERTEAEMRRVYRKFFSQPSLPRELRSLRRRAWGNLHLMLAGSYWSDGSRRHAILHLLAGGLLRPGNFIKRSFGKLASALHSDAIKESSEGSG